KTQIQADNFTVDTLNLLAAGSIPEDASAVVIAAPKQPFQQPELDAISRYMDARGRLILLVDPFQSDSNAEDIIKRWDLTIGKGVAIDPVSSLQQSPATLIIQRYGLHSIVKDLGNKIAVMPFSTSIDIPNFMKQTVHVNSLAQTFDTRSWLETKRKAGGQYAEGKGKTGSRTL